MFGQRHHGRHVRAVAGVLSALQEPHRSWRWQLIKAGPLGNNRLLVARNMMQLAVSGRTHNRNRRGTLAVHCKNPASGRNRQNPDKLRGTVTAFGAVCTQKTNHPCSATGSLSGVLDLGLNARNGVQTAAELFFDFSRFQFAPNAANCSARAEKASFFVSLSSAIRPLRFQPRWNPVWRRSVR